MAKVCALERIACMWCVLLFQQPCGTQMNPGLRHQYPLPFLVISSAGIGSPTTAESEARQCRGPPLVDKIRPVTRQIRGFYMRHGIMGRSSSVQHTFFATDRAAVAAESMVPAFRDGWNGSKRSGRRRRFAVTDEGKGRSSGIRRRRVGGARQILMAASRISKLPQSFGT